MRSSAPVRPSCLLAALVVAIPAASAAMDVRLTPELTAGGGWANAIYIGDIEGEGWQSHVTPGLAVDLSTGPVVKILSAYRFTWSRYAGDRSSLFHDGEITVRTRLGRSVDLDIRGAVDSVSFEDAAGTLAGDATTPPATTSTGLDGGPLLRWRVSERTTTEAALDAGQRTSDLEDASASSVREDYLHGTLAVRHRFASDFEAAVRYRHVRNHSDESLWSYDGDGGQLSVGWAPWGGLLVRGWAGLQWNRFDERRDRYAWAGLGASLPVAPGTTAELAWSFGENEVTESRADADWSGVAGTRHLLWSGLRVELPWWL
jgi:hypothetical protein